MNDLPTLPKAAYSLDLNDGHPVVAYSVQQMYDFARAALAREQEAQARDAARYRHIRQKDPQHYVGIRDEHRGHAFTQHDGEALDEAIDAQRPLAAQPAAQEPSGGPSEAPKPEVDTQPSKTANAAPEGFS